MVLIDIYACQEEVLLDGVVKNSRSGDLGKDTVNNGQLGLS